MSVAIGKGVGCRFPVPEAMLMSIVSTWIQRIRILFWPVSSREIMPLAPPVIAELLPDIPGGEPNLLPGNAWLAPLRVSFPMWENSEPAPGDPEYLRLYWNDVLVEEKIWTQPVQPDELFIMVEQHRLIEGQHQLRYSVVTANQVQTDSQLLAIVIDKTAPVFEDEGALIFPDEIISNGLTAAWFDAHGDTLLAEVPAYFSPGPGDRITWYWSTTPTGSEHTGTFTLEASDTVGVINVPFDRQMVLESGDGVRYTSYKLKDRSGNASPRSLAVSLQVSAQPVPRVLPPPRITETSGSSSSTLDPYDAMQGAHVEIPDTAVIYPGETVCVQWGTPGTVGAYRTEPAESVLFTIPSTHIAPHFDKSIPVYYEVIERGVELPHTSRTHTLRVSNISGFPVVQCDKVSGGRLSLGGIASGGKASFTLASWSFMGGPGQFINIEVRGTDDAGLLVVVPVVTNFPVLGEAATIAVGHIFKVDLQRFKIGGLLEVRVRVSFDEKLTWQPFPSLTPTLYP